MTTASIPIVINSGIDTGNPLGPLIALLLAFELGHIYEKKILNLEEDYIEMRFKLTFSVRICHLLMIGFIFTNQ